MNDEDIRISTLFYSVFDNCQPKELNEWFSSCEKVFPIAFKFQVWYIEVKSIHIIEGRWLALIFSLSQFSKSAEVSLWVRTRRLRLLVTCRLTGVSPAQSRCDQQSPQCSGDSFLSGLLTQAIFNIAEWLSSPEEIGRGLPLGCTLTTFRLIMSTQNDGIF